MNAPSGPVAHHSGVDVHVDPRAFPGLPIPDETADLDDLVWKELADQFGWYDRTAGRNRVCYQTGKIAALALGAAVTVLAAVRASAVVTAALAATVVLLEGAQQVFQFHANWMSYRATAELLRQHAFLFAARVDPYSAASTRRRHLAEVLHTVTSSENRAWRDTMRQSESRPETG